MSSNTTSKSGAAAGKPKRQEYQSVAVAMADDEHDEDTADVEGIGIAVDDEASSTKISAQNDESDEEDDYVPKSWVSAWARELRVVIRLGWATSLSQVLQFTSGFVMMMFLDADEMGGAGMGLMFGNVTGISLILGFGTGLFPLASQAFGAKNYKRVGDLVQRQILLHMLLVCLPVSILWLFTEDILIAVNQPAEIAQLTGSFLRWRIVALPFIALQQDLEALMQCVQAPVVPRMLLYAVSAALNLILFFVLIDGNGTGLGLGFVGAPLALTITNIATALGLWWLTPSLVKKETWPVWTVKAACSDWWELIWLSTPGALMLWAEWWGSELNLFLAGLLCAGTENASETQNLTSRSALDSINSAATAASAASCIPVDVFPLLIQMVTIFFMVHLGFSMQGGAHIGNLLGANRPARARTASKAVLAFVGSIGFVLCVGMLIFRNQWGRLFTHEQDMLDMIAALTPFVGLSAIGDALSASALSNILRGAGIVKAPAVINILSYYAWGIPIGIWLAFSTPGWGVYGLWTGLNMSLWTMVVGLVIYLLCKVNFEVVAAEASARARRK